MQASGVEFLSILGMGVVLVTALLLFVLGKPKIWFVALAIQYVGVFFIVLLAWPASMALIKIVAGWVAVAAIAIAEPRTEIKDSAQDTPQVANRPWARKITELMVDISENLFRLMVAGLVLLVVVSTTLMAIDWIPGVGLPQVFGGLILISMGLLQLAMTGQVTRVFIGLLTFLSGFEIIYAAVEQSTLVAGLMAGVTLALSLVCAYLLQTTSLEIDQ